MYMMNTIKYKTIFIGLLIGLASFGVFMLVQYSHNPRYSLRVISVENGYGYEISINHTPVIYQSQIPAVTGIQRFDDKVSARKTGRLVIKKLKSNQSPTITPKELSRLGIQYKKLQ